MKRLIAAVGSAIGQFGHLKWVSLELESKNFQGGERFDGNMTIKLEIFLS